MKRHPPLHRSRSCREGGARDEKLRSEIRAGADVRAQLEEVTNERKLLLERLAARDRQFAAEVKEYRSGVDRGFARSTEAYSVGAIR